jgi:hypothetical protein
MNPDQLAALSDQQALTSQPGALQGQPASEPQTNSPGSSQESVFKGQIGPQDKATLLEFIRKTIKSANGVYSASFTENGSGVNVSIPHGLGVTPSIASVSAYSLVGTLPGGAGTEITVGVYISATGPGSVTMDATNIYVTIFTGTGTASRTVPIAWSAAIFPQP